MPKPSAPTIDLNALPYIEYLESRPVDSIELVVVHCTELPDLATAREYGERIHYPDSGTGNSGHFYIERNGQIEQWVPLDRVAHHVRNHNHNSVGIELVNRGRYPDWLNSGAQSMTEPYPSAQITALLELLRSLVQRLPMLGQITAHSVLDTTQVPSSDQPDQFVYRKQDPGPMFPWDEVLTQTSLSWFDPGD